jgi:Tol biopolymer transport system component
MMLRLRRRSTLLAFVLLAVGFPGAAAPTTAAGPGQIAFESDRGGTGYHVWVMDANGRSQTKLTPFTPSSAGRDSQGFDPAWSPSGKQLVFESGFSNEKYSDLWVMNANGSNPQQLTDLGSPTRNPAWSPDGRRIAFQNNGTGTYAIYVMAAKPKAPARSLTLGLKSCADPAWSPDGTKIAFDQGGDIYVMDASGKGRRPLKSPGIDANPSWSPDGKWIAFGSTRSGSYQIWVMNSTTSRLTRQLTGKSRSEGQNFDPSWSPDGRRIAFTSNRDGNLEIYSMTTAGTSQTRLTTDPGVDLVPNYSQPPRS